MGGRRCRIRKKAQKTMSKATGIYLRVSSKRQDHKSQLPDMERWAAAQTEPIVWYKDKFTGKTMDRPGWRKLQADLEAAKIGRIVCWRLDRLGRNAKGLTSLFADLQERGIGLVSLKEGLDLKTPAGRMMANVLASLAQFENEVRSERVLAGQAAARAAGKKWGGRRVGTRIAVTVEKEHQIRKMARDGHKIAAISRVVGISRQTIYKVLAK